MQAASPPPQSDSKQHRARIPRRIQSHRRSLDEFFVVVVGGGFVCAPPVTLVVVTDPDSLLTHPTDAKLQESKVVELLLGPNSRPLHVEPDTLSIFGTLRTKF